MAAFLAADREPQLKAPFICGSDSLADNLAVIRLRADTHHRHSGPAQRWSRPLLSMVLAGLLLSPLSAPRASDSRDHERARAAVEAGQILPLPALLERLRRTHPGQVLELELERENGRWIYEVKLLQANGQLLKLELDAATAQVLQAKRKGMSKDERKDERKDGMKSAPRPAAE
jgi:Peptidase propeptide and YPEB domain